MTTNDIPTRPKSQNPRLNRRNQSSGRCQADEIRIKRTMTAAHRSSSKLPNVLAKANIYSSAPVESMIFKRFYSSTGKINRQETTNSSQTGLPTLYTLTSHDDQRRLSDFRRRQIYALNHLMRDLEQAQFREFCKSQAANMNKQEQEKSSST